MKIIKHSIKEILLVILFLVTLIFSTGCRCPVCMNDKVSQENIGQKLNSKYDDYAVFVSSNGDTLFFTSNKGKSGDSFLNDESKYGDDLYLSVKCNKGWKAPNLLEASPSALLNEGAISFSDEGKTAIISRSHEADGLGGSDLYSAHFDGEKFTGIKNLGTTINTIYWESQPALSSDGKTLIFASDRPGGLGGVDLWISEFNGYSWSNPVNLGNNINTAGNEYSPFLLCKGKERILFYASDGIPNGKGKLDIYYSYKLCDNSWGKPKPLNESINTAANEAFPFVTKNAETIYYSSDKEGGCDGYDIYSQSFAIDPPLVNVHGKVVDALTNFPLDREATIEFIDLKTNKTIRTINSYPPQSEYKINEIPAGNFNVKITAMNYDDSKSEFSIANCSNEFIHKLKSQCFKLTGTVVNSRTGEPLKVEAKVSFIDPNTNQIIAEAKTHMPESEYVIEKMCPGKYDVHIKPEILENMNEASITGYSKTRETLDLDYTKTNIIHKITPWEFDLLENKIPYFVTGYYRINTPANLKELREKQKTILKNATYIEKPDDNYDRWAKVVERIFQDTLVSFVRDTILPHFSKDINKDKMLEITIAGYADPRKLIGNYLEKSIHSDGININKYDVLDKDNKLLTLLRAYFTKQYLESELMKDESYRKLKEENRIHYIIKGMGEDKTDLKLELKRRIQINFRSITKK